MTDTLENSEIAAALADLPDWQVDGGALIAAYACPTARAALALVSAIGDVAEESNHHPDVDWRYDHVFVLSSSHDVGGKVTQRDLDLAGRVSSLAGAAGATAEPSSARRGG